MIEEPDGPVDVEEDDEEEDEEEEEEEDEEGGWRVCVGFFGESAGVDPGLEGCLRTLLLFLEASTFWAE